MPGRGRGIIATWASNPGSGRCNAARSVSTLIDRTASFMLCLLRNFHTDTGAVHTGFVRK